MLKGVKQSDEEALTGINESVEFIFESRYKNRGQIIQRINHVVMHPIVHGQTSNEQFGRTPGVCTKEEATKKGDEFVASVVEGDTKADVNGADICADG